MYKVVIIDKKDGYKKAIFTIEEVTLRYQRYDGAMSPELLRLNLERGDGVAAILHDPNKDTVTLIEQFRYSTYEKSGGWITELPAGIVEAGEDPVETIRRELIEEVGYHALLLHPISTFYLSPGGSSERIHLYYARLGDKVSGSGGGLFGEGEDIKTITTPVDVALQMMRDGELHDAKTLIGLQWLQLNRSNLPGSPQSTSV